MSCFPFHGDFRQFGFIWQNSAFKMSQGFGKCPFLSLLGLLQIVLSSTMGL